MSIFEVGGGSAESFDGSLAKGGVRWVDLRVEGFKKLDVGFRFLFEKLFVWAHVEARPV